MRPSFHPRLINGPFDDPGVYIPFSFENRAMLFDLGDIHALSSKDILKISHVFVTHTHMDHFVGFDRLLRLLLGRDKTLFVFGPRGILENVQGKLAGYSWNLVAHYENRFILNVSEVRSDRLLSLRLACQDGFSPRAPTETRAFSGTLLSEPALTVTSAILDHNLSCLGFSLKEHFHVNILKDRVRSLELEIGPWLKNFKEALFQQLDRDSEFSVPRTGAPGGQRRFKLGELADAIAIITAGQKITYIADAGMSAANEAKMLELAKDADHLFIEAAFLETDRQIAHDKYHLTARQAGTIAAKAEVKQFTLFHFSPRYTGQEQLLQKEARQAFDAFAK